MFADPDLITNSYGTNVFDGSQRAYGFIFPGSDGHLLCAQIAYALFISGTDSLQPICGCVLCKCDGHLLCTQIAHALFISGLFKDLVLCHGAIKRLC